MKKVSACFRACLCLIFLCVSILAQEFQAVQDGIEYAKLTRQMKSADGKPENVVFNLLRLNLTKVRLDVVHAMDAAIGTETVSSIATRHSAIAAINAGFFRLDKSIFAGDAAGVLMIDGKLLSESVNNRIALIVNNFSDKTEVFINRLSVSQTVSIGNKTFEVTGINRQRGENDLVIYTPEFHFTTLTDKKGIEIVVHGNKILKALNDTGSIEIPSYSFVISASGKFREQLSEVAHRNVGVTLGRQWNNLDSKISFDTLISGDVVGGVPQLIKNGKIDITWEQEKTSKVFVETHHPRTAVAKLKDGKFLMVTVDGRSEASGGISLLDLAAFLLEMGATDAMNLDGGGSTTMFLNGKVVNHPSDKEGERKVGDAILVTLRKKN
ncbi:MAG: phosphodiester glycosidase family protein [Acidobacteriota bacterium]|nr:phosphodiester glycosidase family protein [Acidobacteriota bacterium]